MPPPAEGFAARFVLGPALRTQPDRRLVTLVREGYENAFEEIVRRYGKSLNRYAAAIVGGRAEDVTQDAFSKALLALRRDGAEIELRPWLFRIVRNTALNDLRDRPPSAEALAEAIASGGNPAEELERREELTDLMQRLQSLPEAQRAAIVMRELEGLSHEEIANALGLSDGGARQAIYRARRALRDGAGMLLPLPLLEALLAGATSAPAVEAAAGAAGVGGTAGAGMALKAAAATVLVAGAVGTGVAIDQNRHADPERTGAQGTVADEPGAGPFAAGATPAAATGESSGEGSGDRGEDHSGHGGGSDQRSDDDRGHSGPGSRHDTEPGDDRGGSSGPSQHGGAGDDGGHSGRSLGGSSGPGSGSSGDGGGSDDSAGPGSGGSAPSGESSGSTDESSSNSGSGPGDDGSGSGEEGDSSGSGSGGSGDPLGGAGSSIQTEPQTQEEP